MAEPFVISMKLVGDSTSGVAAVKQQQVSLDHLNATISGASIPAAQRHAAVLGAEAAAHRTAETAAELHSAALVRSAAAMRQASANRTNLIFQLNDIGVSLASGMNPLMVAIQQGSQIATIYGAQQGGLGAALRETGKLALAGARAFLPFGLAIGAVTVGIAGLTTEINRNQEQQVSMGDVIVASWELASAAVLDALAPIAEWFANLWDQVAPSIADVMTNIIRSFDLGFRDVKTIWSMLPTALGDFAISSVNNVLKATEDMLNQGRTQMIAFLLQAQQTMGPFFAGPAAGAAAAALNSAGDFSFGRVDNPFAGSEKDLQRQLAMNRLGVMMTDYEGIIGNKALEVAGRGAAEAAGKAKDAYKSLADGGLKAMEEAARQAREEFDFFKVTFNSVFSDIKSGLQSGMSAWDAFANAGANALDKIADRALGMAADGIFDMIFGAVFGSGFGNATGGILNNVLGGGPVRAGFNLPGYAAGTSFHPGGSARVHGEEIIELPRGTRVHTAQSSASMGAGGDGLIVNIHNNNGSKVETRTRKTADGKRELEVFILNTVRDAGRRGAVGF